MYTSEDLYKWAMCVQDDYISGNDFTEVAGNMVSSATDQMKTDELNTLQKLFGDGWSEVIKDSRAKVKTQLIQDFNSNKEALLYWAATGDIK